MNAMTQPKVYPNKIQTATTPIGVEANQLRAFVERIERLRAEKADLAAAEKEVFAEAKSQGYMTKPLRMVIGIRARAKDDVDEEAAWLDMYKSALGMT